MTAGQLIMIAGSPLTVRQSAEGVDWIRGWHTHDSAEGKALLAAHALATEGPTGPTGATGYFGGHRATVPVKGASGGH